MNEKIDNLIIFPCRRGSKEIKLKSFNRIKKNCQMKSYEELKTENLPAHNTAIIVIDVWDKTNFDNFVSKSLNPFLEKAKEAGYFLINAPSQGKVNQNLTKVFDYTYITLNLFSQY